MGKVKKVIAGVVVTALVGTAIGGGLMYVRKGNQKEVMVASVSDLMTDYYGNDATLSGNVYANATQRITVDKDMVIQEVYVSKGDEVKPGDKLISFDMTLVEMELNIAKLKLQKQQQDLATAKKRLTSLQNGGPILDTDSSSADNLIDSGTDSGSDSGSDYSSDSGDDLDLSSANVTASDHYLAAIVQPLLLAAVTDVFDDAGDTAAVGSEEAAAADDSFYDETPDLSEGDLVDDSMDEMDGLDGTDEMDGGSGDPGTASDYYDPPADDTEEPVSEEDGFNSGDGRNSGNGGFVSDGGDILTPAPEPTPVLPDGSEFVNPDDQAGDGDFTDGDETFYQTLDYDTQPYQGSGTQDDPFLFLCSSAKGKVNVTGAFLNKMAGYNADGTIILEPGGYWYLLEFHKNDTIADYTDRKSSCTGYYLIEGNMLSNPVDRFAEMDFTLDGAMQYDNGSDDDPVIPDDGGNNNGGSTLSRKEAIRIQKNRIASLQLDIQESEINISKLEKKASRKLITSKLDGIVTTVGDAATGTNSESDAFIAVKSKDGYYVQGTVGELILDEVKEGTILNCNSYGENGYMMFEAEVVQVSDYAVDGDNYFYYGDSNPNVSSYTFTAKITDDSAQVSVGDWVDIQLNSQSQNTDGIVLSKAFVRTEDGVSYVYKDNNGVLKKQIVKVKENVNGGMYVLISSGISADDKIAFPYSKSIQEGMKTKAVNSDSLDTFMGYDSTSYSGGLG